MDEIPDVSNFSGALPLEMRGTKPLDRISVREHFRDLELYDAASGTTETVRFRFDVVLEIVHTAASWTDDLEQVVSYRNIVAVIDRVLEDEDTGLLEILAERVAQGCLEEARAVQVHVDVEKIGDSAGALGVQIVRRRPRFGRPLPAMTGRERREPAIRTGPRPFVAHLPASTLRGMRSNEWCDALAEWDAPRVICVGPLVPQPSPASDGQLRIGLLAVEQSAWALSDHDLRFQVVSTREEIEWALEQRVPAIWAPCQMIVGTPGGRTADASDPGGLAAWLAREIDGELVLLGAPEEDFPPLAADRHARSPEQLFVLHAAS